jgi:hypothetical protein
VRLCVQGSPSTYGFTPRPDDIELDISMQFKREVDCRPRGTARHSVPALLERHRDVQPAFAHRSVH